MESDYSDRDWLWQARQDGRISPAMAQQVHERLCDLEARLAVLGKVEEMLRADWDRKVELGSSSTKGFYASDESHCNADFVCYYGATLLDALAALVDGASVEAKGSE